MFDFEPATRTLTRLVEGVADDQLGRPTPCEGTSVAGLLDHIDGLAGAFADAARKVGGEQGASVDASRLGDDWRPRISDRLADLALAWKDEDAWEGTTHIAGMDLPGPVAASIAIDEVIVHGWDLAVATDQVAEWPDPLVEAAVTFVEPTASQNPEGIPGMFGAARPWEPTDPPLDRLLALTGRDRAWRPGGAGD